LIKDDYGKGQVANVPVYVTVENAKKYKEKLAAEAINFPKLIHLKRLVLSAKSKNNEWERKDQRVSKELFHLKYIGKKLIVERHETDTKHKFEFDLNHVLGAEITQEKIVFDMSRYPSELMTNERANNKQSNDQHSPCTVQLYTMKKSDLS